MEAAPYVTAENTTSVTEASRKGVSRLVAEAESGKDALISRHGRPVAAMIGVDRMNELRSFEADVRSAAVVLARLADDTGVRVELADVIRHFGFDVDELRAEVAEEMGL